MENCITAVVDATAEYHPIRSCDSDDSQSSASRSEDHEAIPGIIYTSDDSADVGQSDSTSNISNYSPKPGNRKKEDDTSQQLLLESDMMSELNSSAQPSPQVECFVSHPLNSVTHSLSASIDHIGSMSRNSIFEKGKVQLQATQAKPGENLRFTRNNSTSSSSTEMEYAAEVPFLARYEPLSHYNDDTYTGGLNFDILKDDPIKEKAIHEHLKTLMNNKETSPCFKNTGDKCFVGDVPIDSQYQDAFFVKWNWSKIRQTCVCINLSMLFGFLCLGVGLVIQMPKGSDCNPVQEWWQGTTSYHIFVPSFQDTDGNGFGDLHGVIERLDYIQGLGIKSIRLAPIFPSENFLKEGEMVTNYTSVSSLIGDTRDLHLLAALLHERDMFLILDLPLVKFGNLQQRKEVEPEVNLKMDISSVLSHWMKFGVDGFAFTDLHKLDLDKQNDLIPAIYKWRNVLDQKTYGLHRRIFAVPVNFLNNLKLANSLELNKLLHVINLIDVRLDMTQPAESLAEAIQEGTQWDNHPSLPWVNWRLGGPFEPRIADTTTEKIPGKIPALGFLMLQLFLPGSVTLYYGDEIGLTLTNKNEIKLSWAAPMSWSPQNGGFSTGSKPWLSLGKNWKEHNVASLNESMNPLRIMIEASQKEVPLYINGIFDEIGTFHPKKSSNYKIRCASDNLLIMDRFYPRRHKFAIVINLGGQTLKKDLSKLYYGGKVLASSDDKEGYVRFKDITLRPREALALVLDK